MFVLYFFAHGFDSEYSRSRLLLVSARKKNHDSSDANDAHDDEAVR
jgi:hypothetical protein